MPVLVEGTVDFSIEGSQAHLSANGVRLDFHLENLPHFWRDSGFSKWQTAKLVVPLSLDLQARGLSLCLHSKVQPVVLIGKEARPGLLSRLLRAPGVEIKHWWLFLKLCLS